MCNNGNFFKALKSLSNVENEAESDRRYNIKFMF